MSDISKKIRALAAECEAGLQVKFAEFDEVSRHNTEKTLEAFRALQLGERHFFPTSGYGYNDDGRELCDAAFARVFGCERGFARHSIVSGTHALGIGLFGLLRPGDTLLSITGKPYDTLEGIIGIRSQESGDGRRKTRDMETRGRETGTGDGSLADFGVNYRQIELKDGKSVDTEAVMTALAADKSVKVVYAQRSRGYLDRPSLSAAALTELYHKVKSVSGAYFVADNCYGEFCETEEPKADLLIGSLIKNPGGGIAESGAYITGTEKAVELAAGRLTVPGIGLECGASLGQTKNMLKGLFLAPHTVAQALKTAAFASALFSTLGYKVSPLPLEKRYDIIQTVSLGAPKPLEAFCKGLQSGSPVDSYAAPEAWDMPGYADRVIMAAGAFTQGSSLELSADGPLKAPYTVFLQGGLTYESGRYGIMRAAEELRVES